MVKRKPRLFLCSAEGSSHVAEEAPCATFTGDRLFGANAALVDGLDSQENFPYGGE